MRKAFILALAGLAALMFVPVAGQAAIVPETQLCADPALDGETLEDLQPAEVDIIGCSIREDNDFFYIKWTVADINDATGLTPNVSSYYFNFSVTPAIGDPRSFQLTATSTRSGASGSLAGNCTVTGGLTQCNTTIGSPVVTVDRAANTLEAKVKRTLLKGTDNAVLAVDGSVLAEDETIFAGIATCVNFVAVTSGTMCDRADITETDGTYTFGG